MPLVHVFFFGTQIKKHQATKMRSGKHAYVLMCSPEGKAAMKCHMAHRAAKQEQQNSIIIKNEEKQSQQF